MKKLSYFILITILAILLSACAVNSQARGPNIEGITWVLTSYNDVRPIDGALPTMELEGGQVSGTTGCNHYGGSYQITGDAISFEDFYRTEIGCTEPEGVMDQERIYLDLLRSADRFVLSESEDVLTIFAGEHQILVFETKNEVSLSAPTSMRKSELSRGDVATEAQKPGILTLLPFALLGNRLWVRCMLGSSLGCCHLRNGFQRIQVAAAVTRTRSFCASCVRSILTHRNVLYKDNEIISTPMPNLYSFWRDRKDDSHHH